MFIFNMLFYQIGICFLMYLWYYLSCMIMSRKAQPVSVFRSANHQINV